MGNTDKFEQIAAAYDTPERIQLAQASAKGIRKCLADMKEKKAIDFGCGTGLVGLELLEHFRSILFLDSSQNMIEQVKKKLLQDNIENADTLCFDLEKAEQTELRADYIFMAQVLLHIGDVKWLLSRLYEILNDNGHLIIVDFDKNEKVTSPLVHCGFDQQELACIMEQMGYGNIRWERFYEGRNIFMGQDATLFVLDAQKI
ncbi:class I SAM-dependent methyltransferase [Aminipila butyrica]|uniref:Class I SAM-dependent methyltransferase n=1 Tax=Aminipila butyrica TaxID=433296 RepID=A0A858BUX4_9FIRM|nr:class I SAM-dependent methyltransferase [Aminipila butyrica]QIB68730.1 class I SAM-dependent methyltransferase [Aminipila butyrica]